MARQLDRGQQPNNSAQPTIQGQPQPFSSPIRPPARPRSRRTSFYPTGRTYRQVTLSECFNTCPSSPLGPRTPSENLRSFDLDLQSEPVLHHRSNSFQRPTLTPLVFNSNSSTSIIRPRFDRNFSSALEPSHHPSIADYAPSSDPLSSFHPPSSPPTRSRICSQRRPPLIDHFFDFELSYKKSSYYETRRRLRFLESLHSDPETHTIKMWNSEYEHGHEFPFSLAFNQKAKIGPRGRPAVGGELLAVASALGNICLYRPSEIGSAEDRLPILNLEGLQNGIFALTFSPSDTMIGTGSGAQVSEFFDVETGNLIGRAEAHAGTVKSLEFSPYNEKIVVTGSRDGSIKVWDLRIVGAQLGDHDVAIYPPVITIQHAHDEKYTGRKRKKGVHVPSVSSVLWSRLGDQQIYSAGSANGIVKLWDIRTKSEYNSKKKTHPNPADQSIDHHQNTDDFIWSTREANADVDVGSEGIENPEGVGFGSLRPHGVSCLVSASDGARIYALGTDSVIRTHDPLYLSRPLSSQLRSFSHPTLIGTSLYLKLALSADDQYLGCSSSTGEIYLWDTTANPSSIDQGSRQVDCGEDLDHLVKDDGVARKSKALDGPVVLYGHRKEVCGLQFWKNGLASCSDDATVRLWTYRHAPLDSH